VVQEFDGPWHKYLFIILYLVPLIITFVHCSRTLLSGLCTAATGNRECRRDRKLHLRFISLFTVYLTTLIIWWWTNNLLEGIWNEEVMSWFKAGLLILHLSGEIEENHETSVAVAGLRAQIWERQIELVASYTHCLHFKVVHKARNRHFQDLQLYLFPFYR
jgi:hypothetical protein